MCTDWLRVIYCHILWHYFMFRVLKLNNSFCSENRIVIGCCHHLGWHKKLISLPVFWYTLHNLSLSPPLPLPTSIINILHLKWVLLGSHLTQCRGSEDLKEPFFQEFQLVHAQGHPTCSMCHVYLCPSLLWIPLFTSHRSSVQASYLPVCYSFFRSEGGVEGPVVVLPAGLSWMWPLELLAWTLSRSHPSDLWQPSLVWCHHFFFALQYSM